MTMREDKPMSLGLYCCTNKGQETWVWLLAAKFLIHNSVNLYYYFFNISTFLFLFCCCWLLLQHVADSYLLWTGGRTADSDSLLCSLTSFSQTPDYIAQSQKITDNKKWMTYTLHSQKEIYLRKEERKGLDKKVQVNLVWIC